ncbi:hypothetical protein WJX74_004149 [Apatococcus lobatus]|uniref:Uncharacterized protein n=1 Tax=Apatococcus lobatus TaxID=904363 RepID=A0AAW1Q8A6_9CHLO
MVQGQLHEDTMELLIAAHLQAIVFTKVYLQELRLVRDTEVFMKDPRSSRQFLAGDLDGSGPAVQVARADAKPQATGRSSTDVGFLDPSYIVLTDTASGDCCAFDVRMVFLTDTRPILVLVSVKRIEAGPQATANPKAYSYVDTTAFSDKANTARATAREAADKLGADVMFLTVHTGDASRVPDRLQASDRPEDLAFLVAEGLSGWLPQFSSRPGLATRHTEIK